MTTTTESPPARWLAVLALAAAAMAIAAASPAATRPPYLKVVGTAQDGGLPHAGCRGPRCRLARVDPAARRLVASVALVDPAQDPPRVFLIDATPDLVAQLERLAPLRPAPADGAAGERVDRAPVDGVLLTHAHMGHYLGLAFFGYEAMNARRLPVWATPRMAAYLSENGPWSQLVDFENVDLRPLAPGQAVELTPRLSVTALRVPHRDELSDTVGFLVDGPSRRLLYVPDTDRWDSWDPPLAAVLEDVDVAIVDGTFYSTDELPGRSVEQIGHPLVTTSMELLAGRVAAGDLEVHFTHLNHSNPALDPNGPAARALRERGFHVLAEDAELDL